MNANLLIFLVNICAGLLNYTTCLSNDNLYAIECQYYKFTCAEYKSTKWNVRDSSETFRIKIVLKSSDTLSATLIGNLGQNPLTVIKNVYGIGFIEQTLSGNINYFFISDNKEADGRHGAYVTRNHAIESGVTSPCIWMGSCDCGDLNIERIMPTTK